MDWGMMGVKEVSGGVELVVDEAGEINDQTVSA